MSSVERLQHVWNLEGLGKLSDLGRHCGTTGAYLQYVFSALKHLRGKALYLMYPVNSVPWQTHWVSSTWTWCTSLAGLSEQFCHLFWQIS
eukprot:jgi/Botrbrau1/1626/Bobra.0185s0041.1